MAAVGAGALAQSVSGIGFVLVCGPALVAALGPTQGVRLAVALSMPVNVIVLAGSPHRVAWRRLLPLAGAALLATPPLALAVRALPGRAAQVGAGLATALGAATLAAGLRWRRAAGTAGAVAAGVVSALMNLLAGIGGPAAALYAANAGWPAGDSRSTLQVYFLALNVVALTSIGLPHIGLLVWLLSGAALFAGLLLGRRAARLVSEPAARRTTLLLAGCGGLLVVLRAVLR